MITFEDFCKCTALLEIGTGKPMTAEQVELWYELLGDLPLNSLQAAIKRALLENEYPVIPPVGRIRRLASEHASGIPIDAEQAFARVREAISQFGWPDPGKAAEFLGPAIWSVVQGVGGWQRICDSPPDQRQALFSQFRDGWQRAAARQQRDNLLPEDVRPQQRVEGHHHPAVRLLADSMREVS